MMRQENLFRYADAADYQIIKMPYSERISMYVLLPHDINGLRKLEERLSPQELADILVTVSRRRASKVILSLPKFTFDSGISLAPHLKSLNLHSIFTSLKNNFPLMSDSALAVTNIFHKAIITLDEEGTEAAAVTVIIMGTRLAPQAKTEIIFNADHPFLFLIREEVSGSILFLGRYMN
jgi:serpin B